MSHFTVGVILPKINHEDIEGVIAELLEPYNENRAVEAYEQSCYCVNSAARQHGRKMADKLVGTWEERKSSFRSQPGIPELEEQKARAWDAKDDETVNALEDERNARWREYVKPFIQDRDETEDAHAQSHPLYLKPRPDCEECDGTGISMTTYNPQSQWDWYRVGGRWDGRLVGNPQDSENGFNFDPKHETISNNSLPVNELLQRYEKTGELFTFFALVTPKGEWIEKGDMGWWGVVIDEKNPDAWRDQSLSIYSLYAGHDVVLLDCHI